MSDTNEPGPGLDPTAQDERLVPVVVDSDGVWCSTPTDEGNGYDHVRLWDREVPEGAPHRVDWWTAARIPQEAPMPDPAAPAGRGRF